VTSSIGLLINDRNPVPPIVRAFVEIAQEARVNEHLDRYKPINPVLPRQS
jgi:hypothetical protein